LKSDQNGTKANVNDLFNKLKSEPKSDIRLLYSKQKKKYNWRKFKFPAWS